MKRRYPLIILCILLICGIVTLWDTNGFSKSSKDPAKREAGKSVKAAKKTKHKARAAAVKGAKQQKHQARTAAKGGKQPKRQTRAAIKGIQHRNHHPHPGINSAPERLALRSASALVADQQTGECLVQKNANAVVPIASITKLVTAMVTLDANLDLHETIVVGLEDVDTLRHSRSHLPVGTRLTRQEALLLALMASENRAAHALSRTYPGGRDAFVFAMNAKARSLGLSDTRFTEATGLSSGNMSSAHDLARMANAAYSYPLIREFTTREDTVLQSGRRKLVFRNTNGLIRSSRWQIGLSKTGFIDEAGRCLVMQAKVADRPVVIVLLDAHDRQSRVGDANRIKNWMERQPSLRQVTVQG